YIINGEKIFITNGARASWVVVFATVDPSLGRAGHRAFVVEKGTPGFTTSRVEEKMGLRANETAELLRSEEHTSELQSRFDLVCFFPSFPTRRSSDLLHHQW